MTPDQQFTISLLQALGPYFAGLASVAVVVTTYLLQRRTLKQTQDASRKAEAAANHSKEISAALQANFAAVVKIIRPDLAGALPETLPAPSNMPPAQP